MSDAITTTTATQPESAPSTPQEQAPVTPQAPAAEQTPDAVSEEDRIRAVEKEAKLCAAKAGRCYGHGEKEYAKGMLAAGRWAGRCVQLRLSVPDTKRDVAIRQVQDKLAAHAREVVDVNRLIRVYHTFRLLAEEPGIQEQVPYTHYRDCWSQLLECLDKGKSTERYVLLPGLEQKCLQAFAQSVGNSLELSECHGVVSRLLGEAKRLETEAAVKAKQDATAEADKARADAKAAWQAHNAVRAALDQAEAKANAAAPEDKPALVAQVDALKAELVAKLRAYNEAQAAADKADDKAGREAKRCDAAIASEQKHLSKPPKGTKPPKGDKPKPEQAPKPVADTKPQPPSPAQMGKAATPEQAAEYCQDAIEASSEPDTVVERLLQRLAKSREVSNGTKRALEMALVSLHRDKHAAGNKPATQPQTANVA